MLLLMMMMNKKGKGSELQIIRKTIPLKTKTMKRSRLDNDRISALSAFIIIHQLHSPNPSFQFDP